MLLKKEACAALIVTILVTSSLSIGVLASSNGISGYSQGCGACHTRPSPTGVTVDVVGVPPTYTPSQTYTITITAIGGPAGTSGGFDMSVTAGSLAPAAGETNVQIDAGEAIHISENGRSWRVDWTAPTPGTGDVTIYIAALCGNGGNGANNDDWEAIQFTSSEVGGPINPPSITITSPSGVSDWTGGSFHDVAFTVSDVEDPAASLLVWLNYSPTGGAPWTTIAGAQGIAGDSSPFSWTLPFEDSLTVAINATVKDTGLLAGYDETPVPIIDSTPPTVLSTLPVDLEPSAPVTTTIEAAFDESMDTASVESALELRDIPTWTLVPGTFSWTLDTVVFTPTSNLNPGTQYQANITTTARDDSDPGNPIASQYEWTFTTEVLNTPPSVTIAAPVGGESWTGGSPHDIAFTATDNEDAPANLFVWLNYSETGAAPWTPIAGAQGIAGDSSPYSWTLPLVDSTTVVVNATVVDTGGLSSWTTSPMFELDSTTPTVTSTSPTNGATGVPVGTNAIATWSESMNMVQTETSFTLVDNLTWTPVTGTVSWMGTVFTFNPDANLNMNEWYTANFTTLAMDDSDPGNPIAAIYSWSFQTAAFVDSEPPKIINVSVDPTPQEVFLSVNVSVEITDNVAIGSVSMEILDPLGGTTTTAMLYDVVTARYYLDQPYSVVGTHDFNITASDTSGNLNWTIGQFVVQDTTPPAITHTPVAFGFVGVPIDIAANVQDNYAFNPVDPVWLNYTDVLGAGYNVTMNPIGGGDYSYQIPAQPSTGTASYFIWAIDEQGNDVMTVTYTIAILAGDFQPPEILNILATPSPQEVFNFVNITATITDSSGVASASVEITWPDLSVMNQTLLYAGADEYYFEQTYDMIGAYSFTIWTNDTNDYWNSSSSNFDIQDTTPPSITHTPVTTGVTGTPIDIAANVQDNYALNPVDPVWLNYTDVLGAGYNVAMNPIGGGDYSYQIPAQTSEGVVTYSIWAMDSSGNAEMTSQYDITISQAPDNEPPVADAGPDQLDNPEGTTIHFNGTGSTDNVGIVSHKWTFDYGPNEITLGGAEPSFVFAEIGIFNVTLNVTDAAGLYDTDTVLVSTVDSTPPTVLAVSPLDDATDVSLEADYVIVFSEPMNTTATESAISINDVTISGYAWSDGNRRLTVDFADLGEDTQYTVSIGSGATDVAGNSIASRTFTFTTMNIPSAPSPSLLDNLLWVVLVIILIVIIVILALWKRRPSPETEEVWVPEPPETDVVSEPEESSLEPPEPPEQVEGDEPA